MRGHVARFMGIALVAASAAIAAPVLAERFDDGLAAYKRNDFAKSLKVLRPLAERGDVRAQYFLGRQYQFGQGTKVDRAEAYYWYRRAEGKGHLEAKLFRILLEKRWNISAADKAKAERRLAELSAPKPKLARIVPKPRPPKRVVEAAAARTPPKPAVTSRPTYRAPSELAKREAPKREVAKRELAKREVVKREPPKREVARRETRRPETNKADVAAVRARTLERPPANAVRNDPPADRRPTDEARRSEVARAAVPPARTDTPRDRDRRRDARDRDARERDDDIGSERETTSAVPEDASVPAETRTAMPPAEPNEASPYREPPPYPPPSYASPPAYSDVPTYPPPSYAPPSYAPAAPPSWRPPPYYAPRPFRGHYWGYRPRGRYVHPGWRGAGWRGGFRFRRY